MTEKRWGISGRGEREYKETQEATGVINSIFTIFIAVMVSQICTYVKIIYF